MYSGNHILVDGADIWKTNVLAKYRSNYNTAVSCGKLVNVVSNQGNTKLNPRKS